jgi:hypothetical protein
MLPCPTPLRYRSRRRSARIGRIIQTPLADLDRDLRVLLDVIRAAGVAPTDVDTRGVSLQDVFISLTGRELREDWHRAEDRIG